MTDLLRTLAEVREKMGYDPLPDPGVIMDDGAPPPEPYPVRPAVDLSQVPDGPVGDPYAGDPFDADDEMEADESPLIPRGPEKPGNFPPEVTPFLNLPNPNLAVAVFGSQGVGAFEGREVSLSAQDQAKVKQVVLKALQRQVQAQLSDLKALLPKRKRKAREPKSVREPGQTAQPALPQTIKFANKTAAEDYIRAGRLTTCVAAREDDHWIVRVRQRKPRKRLDGSER